MSEKASTALSMVAQIIPSAISRSKTFALIMMTTTHIANAIIGGISKLLTHNNPTINKDNDTKGCYI